MVDTKRFYMIQLGLGIKKHNKKIAAIPTMGN